MEAWKNESWTGLPIYNDSDYNKNMPRWTKAYKSANQILVKGSKAVNELTGGDDFAKGAVDPNPAIIEYLLRGHLGGAYSLVNQLIQSAEFLMRRRDFDYRFIPLANRLVMKPIEGSEYRTISNKYNSLSEEVAETTQRERGYKKKAEQGDKEYAKKLDDLYASPEYERMQIFKLYEKYLKELRAAKKETPDPKVQKEIDESIYQIEADLLKVVESVNKK